MYSVLDLHADELAVSFCDEAEKLWNSERDQNVDSILNVAAAEFLSLGYLGRGKDHAVLTYLTMASDMGARLGLFDVNSGGDTYLETALPTMSTETRSAFMYTAWGVFNWRT